MNELSDGVTAPFNTATKGRSGSILEIPVYDPAPLNRAALPLVGHTKAGQSGLLVATPNANTLCAPLPKPGELICASPTTSSRRIPKASWRTS